MALLPLRRAGCPGAAAPSVLPAAAPAATIDVPANPARRGILLAAMAVSLFALQNAAAKWLTADLAVPEIVFFRNLFGLLPALAALWLAGGARRLVTRQPVRQLSRGLCMAAGTGAIFFGFARLPFAEVTALTFAIPLFVTMMSVPLLAEQVGWRRWSAVLAGFAGVLVVTRPGAATVDPVALLVLGGTAAAALALVLGRQLSRTERTATITFYSLVGAAAGSALALPLSWSPPTLPQLGLLAAMGMVSGVALLLMTAAYRLAPAAVAAPFEYLHIVWAVGLGFVLWGEVPGTHVALGTAIVIASGLYILHRETRRGGAPATRAGITPRA